MLALKSTNDESVTCLVNDENGLLTFNTSQLIEDLYKRKSSGEDISDLAKIFHNSLAEAGASVAETVCKERGMDTVLLSGGVFQNRLMLEGFEKRLASMGYQVFFNKKIPANDAGISAGQAIYGVYNA